MLHLDPPQNKVYNNEIAYFLKLVKKKGVINETEKMDNEEKLSGST